MSPNQDRLFRGIWLTNGILLLVMLLGGLSLAALGLLSDLWHRGEQGVRQLPQPSVPV